MPVHLQPDPAARGSGDELADACCGVLRRDDVIIDPAHVIAHENQT
jgi:hypothetical protein